MKKGKSFQTMLFCSVLALGPVLLGCGEDESEDIFYEEDGAGICDSCEGSPCDEGWCADFTRGPSRCVPDHIGLEDPYVCYR